jgi:thiamine-phosphate pyrophosphorylase
MEPVRSPVYVIVNYAADSWQSAAALITASIRGGAGMIQFRTKEQLVPEDISRLDSLVSEAQGADVPFIVNDFVDLAAKVGADGVHVGLSDLPVSAARAALGPEAIVGATTPTAELARRAQEEGASYVAVGAVFRSPTKPEKAVVGLERVASVAAAVEVAVCAIGGITADRMPQVLAAGASLAAVTSAVSAAPDPLGAVRDLVAACRKPED